MGNLVAIVGRPNVGKSTLFNRITESRKAIVDDTSGVTRDRHYGVAEWVGNEFIIVDTGGYVQNSDDVFEKEIKKQVEIAIVEADILLFMVDVVTGITDQDETFARVLRKSGKPILVVVNKVDNFNRINEASVFYKFGFEELFTVSSVSGSGTGELLDKVVSLLPEKEIEEPSSLPKFAILGRPNVGKSTFINALLGEERNIVSSIAGTTRDSIHTDYNKFGHSFKLIDTAGIRKKSKVEEDIEFYSVMRAISALEDADVCFLIIDALEGLESQDINIFHLAETRQKGIVILVNKWDIFEKDEKSTLEFEKAIKGKIAPFVDVPILFISAQEKTRIFKAIEKGMEVYENRQRKIPTHKLIDTITAEIEKNPPPSNKGKFIKIKYITQLPTPGPSFAFFCNLPQYVRESYKRFLENKLRSHFNFEGVPIRTFFRKK